MANQYNSKVVLASGEVLIDLTSDTIDAAHLLSGITAHDKSGAPITGSCTYDVDSSTGNATASEILSGKIAFVRGSRVTGTMPSGGGGQWTTDGIIALTEPSGAIISNTLTIREYLFENNKGITSVSLPSCTAINSNAFKGCSNMLSFSAPEHQSFFQKNYVFQDCTKCTYFYLPKTTIIGTSQFKGCTSLPYIVLPKCQTIYNEALMNCSNLEGADFGPSNTVFERTGIFKNDSKLKTIILRRTSIVPYKVADAFNGTPFANGGSGGTIYIPKSLYDHLGDGTSSDYQSATNWSTLHGYGTITWAKIEGSIYETKYVDGSDIPS